MTEGACIASPRRVRVLRMAARPLAEGQTGTAPLVNFRATHELVDRIERLAESTSQPKSAVIRDLIEAGLAKLEGAA